ncbi:PHP domain-containing protein [Cyanobacterium stanieri LEGE 03274]|uniref:PHP domain-containing protein n=1 Tax=Cyanobacterium stanieri LEGE 03274 TaxID=1828756 RepID=A0ABR9V0S1_9CHRO|nr:PHP domain-containing protein [Cyanobacterium stanieri]MBE9221176.1 PHP domain-containing protein [Cyanobacterium stanieri LEGE 03274]
MLLSKEKKPLWVENKASRNTEKLKQVWATLQPDSCPFRYNFHLHTSCSDGQLTPESLIEQAIQIGLQGLAITDHHSIDGFYRALSWMKQKKEVNSSISLPHLWTGVEITSELNGTIVHILGYGFDPHATAIRKYLGGYKPEGYDAQAQEVINCLHNAGALVALAHPARYRRPAEELITEAHLLGIDGVESYYAYGNPQPWQCSPKQMNVVESMAKKYNLYSTCGTDTHGNNILVRL